MMMNGELVRSAVSIEKGSFLERIAASKLNSTDKIR